MEESTKKKSKNGFISRVVTNDRKIAQRVNAENELIDRFKTKCNENAKKRQMIDQLISEYEEIARGNKSPSIRMDFYNKYVSNDEDLKYAVHILTDDIMAVRLNNMSETQGTKLGEAKLQEIFECNKKINSSAGFVYGMIFESLSHISNKTELTEKQKEKYRTVLEYSISSKIRILQKLYNIKQNLEEEADGIAQELDLLQKIRKKQIGDVSNETSESELTLEQFPIRGLELIDEESDADEEVLCAKVCFNEQNSINEALFLSSFNDGVKETKELLTDKRGRKIKINIILDGQEKNRQERQ